GRSAGPGEVGELVLTNLGRIGSPLLRFRTGDLVKPERNWAEPNESAAPCQCGRSDLVLEGGILGRVDDMVIIRGVNVYPTAVEDLLHSCGGIAEYQVRITRSGPLKELSLFIEPETGWTDQDGLLKRVK